MILKMRIVESTTNFHIAEITENRHHIADCLISRFEELEGNKAYQIHVMFDEESRRILPVILDESGHKVSKFSDTGANNSLEVGCWTWENELRLQGITLKLLQKKISDAIFRNEEVILWVVQNN